MHDVVRTTTAEGPGGSAAIVAIETLAGADDVAVIRTSAGIVLKFTKDGKSEVFDIATLSGDLAEITQRT